MKKHSEFGFAIVMYPKSAKPYFLGTIHESGGPRMMFDTKQQANAYRSGEGIMRKSKTVPVVMSETT